MHRKVKVTMIIKENNKVEIHNYNNKIRGFERVSGFDKAILPARKTAGSCGYDIHIYSATPTTIKPHESKVFCTGIKAYMPSDEFLAIYIRSSIGIKKHLMLKNSVCIIDSDFYNNEDNEGHIIVALYNYGDEPVTLEPFERVAQGVFQKYGVVDNDDANQTRTGGIGSTGTN